MVHCRQITELGKSLASYNQKISIPRVTILGIEEGEYDIQLFLYHFFLKCFWNPDFSFEENAVINYDWYHPQDATRHTLEEVSNWFMEAGLAITHQFVDPYGITIRGKLLP
jgi:hypothetical protein